MITQHPVIITSKYKRIQSISLEEICIGISLVAEDSTIDNETKEI